MFPEEVLFVPVNILISMFQPNSLLLSKVKLLLPGIVFVTFVHVSALKEPVSKENPCDVPSTTLIEPKKFCATLDLTQKDNVIKLELDV